MPIAGTDQQGAGGGATTLNVDTALISYLEAHQGSTEYLVAVSSANQASSIILATNKPVMALGGFTGSDPILTTSQLAALVANNTVRYFLLDGGRFGGGGGGGQSSLTSWITSNCTAVSASDAQNIWAVSAPAPDRSLEEADEWNSRQPPSLCFTDGSMNWSSFQSARRNQVATVQQRVLPYLNEM